MINVYICEKPSQAKDLARILNLRNRKDGYYTNNQENIAVTWAMGHLLEMATPDQYNDIYKKWSIDLLPIYPEKWKYYVKKGCNNQLKIITALIKSSSLVTIATDYDREGEAIARSIIEKAKYKGEIKRLCLTALDDSSILKALNNIKDGNDTINLYYAAQSRAKADWLVGMNLTRLFTCLTKFTNQASVVSIGRVMTPTINLVVERDKKIENFVSKPYYELYAIVNNQGRTYKAKRQPNADLLDEDGYIIDKNIVNQVVTKLSNHNGIVTKFASKIVNQNPPLPFNLNSLQQFCNKRYGYTAKMTLEIAQALYEKHKAITYPRTDCQYLVETMYAERHDVMNALVQVDPFIASTINEADLSLYSKCFNTSKVTAHHAIIPTANNKISITAMSVDEKNVYELIRRAYIAQFYPPAKYNKTQIEIKILDEIFIASSTFLTFPGFRVLYAEDCSLNNYKEESTTTATSASTFLIPQSKVGDILTINDYDIENKETQPPLHFTEATLLGAMEKISRYVDNPVLKNKLKETDGLGTPATRAEIINNSINKDFLCRKQKYILATEKSKAIMPTLPNSIKDAGTTALWEQQLEDILLGKINSDEFIANIKNYINDILTNYKCNQIQLIDITSELKPAKRKYTRRTTKTNNSAKKTTKKVTNKRILSKKSS
jgi:DNA topoisomerase-3